MVLGPPCRPSIAGSGYVQKLVTGYSASAAEDVRKVVVGDVLNACRPVAGGAPHTTVRRCIAAVAEQTSAPASASAR